MFNRMDVRYLMLLSLVAIANSYKECPTGCTCNLDIRGRYQTVCNQGGMISIPINDMDLNTEVLIIRGPRNDLTIGPIFLPLKKLEILRITNSNLPSIGTYSFWGVERLHTLGKIFCHFSFGFAFVHRFDWLIFIRMISSCRFVSKQYN